MTTSKQKRNVYELVRMALYRGELVRPFLCEDHDDLCHGRIEAHHEDYDKPFEVRWLCSYHHTAAHEAERRARPQCEALVLAFGRAASRQCGNAATTQINGQHVCGTHLRSATRGQVAA